MRMGKGIMLINLGECGEAVKCLDEVIAMKPHDPDAHVQKARALEQMGNRAEAIKCCKKMLGWKKLGNYHARRARATIDRLSAG